MNALDTAAVIVATLNNPVVQLGLQGALAVGGALAAYLVATQPKAKDVAQDLADLEEEVGPWVDRAAALDLPGAKKAQTVNTWAKDWLTARDITGRKGRLLLKYLPALIEVAVKKQPPSLAAPKAG